MFSKNFSFGGHTIKTVDSLTNNVGQTKWQTQSMMYIQLPFKCYWVHTVNWFYVKWQTHSLSLTQVKSTNLPQIMSSAHSVMYGNMSNSPCPAFSFFSLSTICDDCSLNTCKKSFKIRKWNDGVSNLRLVLHFSSVLYVDIMTLMSMNVNIMTLVNTGHSSIHRQDDNQSLRF